MEKFNQDCTSTPKADHDLLAHAPATSVARDMLAEDDAQHTPKNEQLQQLGIKLDQFSLEDIVEAKISRFLDQLCSFHPDNLYAMIMAKVEKPLVKQILQRTGGNQVHAAKILGINRNTLRKKIKIYDF